MTLIQRFSSVHRFSVPERDTRDPHFLVSRDKLFVYTGNQLHDFGADLFLQMKLRDQAADEHAGEAGGETA